jgi:hypothetical protein
MAMRKETDIVRVAQVCRSESHDPVNPVSVRLAMASRAAQLYWVLDDPFNKSQQMEMDVLSNDLSDLLKTTYGTPSLVTNPG